MSIKQKLIAGKTIGMYIVQTKVVQIRRFVYLLDNDMTSNSKKHIQYSCHNLLINFKHNY